MVDITQLKASIEKGITQATAGERAVVLVEGSGMAEQDQLPDPDHNQTASQAFFLRMAPRPGGPRDPYDPFLPVLRRYLGKLPSRRLDELIKAAGVYLPQQRLFHTYIQGSPLERHEEILNHGTLGDELQYERRMLLQSISGLLFSLGEDRPLVILLEHLEKCGPSTQALIEYLLNREQDRGLLLVAWTDPMQVTGQENSIENWRTFLRRLRGHPRCTLFRSDGHRPTIRERQLEEQVEPRAPTVSGIEAAVEHCRGLLLFLALEECRSEARELFNQVSEGMPQLPATPYCRLLEVLGLVHEYLGQRDSALVFYGSLLNFALEAGLENQVALAYRRLGHVQILKNSLEAADRSLQQALRIAHQLQAQEILFAAYLDLLLLSSLSMQQGQRCKQYETRVKRLARRMGKPNALCFACSFNLREHINVPRQLRVADAAISIARHNGNRYRLSWLYNYKGSQYSLAARFQASLENYKKSERLKLELGYPLDQACISNSIGHLYFLMEDYRHAFDCFSRSLQILRKIRNYPEILMTLYNMGLTFFYSNNFRKAASTFRKILLLLENLHVETLSYHSVSGLHCLLSLSYLKDGQLAACRRNLPRIRPGVVGNDAEEQAYYLLLQALYAAATGEYDNARRFFRSLIEFLESHRSLSLLRALFPRVYLEWGLVETRAGEKKQATKLYARGEQYCDELHYPFHRELLQGLRSGDRENLRKLRFRKEFFDFWALIEAARQEMVNQELHYTINESNVLNSLHQVLVRTSSTGKLIRDAMNIIHNSIPGELFYLEHRGPQAWRFSYSSRPLTEIPLDLPALVDRHCRGDRRRLLEIPSPAGLVNALYLPLTVDGKLQGAILCVGKAGRPLEERDRHLLVRIARHIRDSMERLDLDLRLKQAYAIIKEDLSLAQRIQENIIPRSSATLGDLSFHTRYLPMGEVGGDLFDIALLDEQRARIFVADATGHGVQAALVTMLIKSEYEKLKQSVPNPAEMLAHLNQEFYHSYKSLNVFFSAFVVDVDAGAGRICYASAGHPSQYLIRETQIMELDTRGKVVGVLANEHYTCVEHEFCPPDRLLLFSDGLYEQFDQQNRQYGEERLQKVVLQHVGASLQDMVDLILADLSRFLGEKEQNDDICLIGIG